MVFPSNDDENEIDFFFFLYYAKVTSMLKNDNALTMEISTLSNTHLVEMISMEYDSIDDLNKLPFSQLPNEDLIADFDDSVDLDAIDESYDAPKLHFDGF